MECVFWQVFNAKYLSVGAEDSSRPSVPQTAFQRLYQAGEQLWDSCCVQSTATAWAEWRRRVVSSVLCTRTGGLYRGA